MSLLKAMAKPLLAIGPLRKLREAFRVRFELRIWPWHRRKPRTRGVTTIKRTTELIVSLTSHPARIASAHLAVNSLLRQSLKPDHVILWLAEEQFPRRQMDLPDDLLALRDWGLTIAWCRDLKSFKKLIPCLQHYPRSLIVTADDDIYYSRRWLEALYAAYAKEPPYIHCHRAHRVKIDAEGNIMPYINWDWCVAPRNASYVNFLTSGGGVLFPPGCFHADIGREDLFSRLTPHADDIWYWAMAVLSGTKIKVLQENRQQMREFDSARHASLYSTNRLEGGNDAQMANVLKYYPQLKEMLVSAANQP